VSGYDCMTWPNGANASGVRGSARTRRRLGSIPLAVRPLRVMSPEKAASKLCIATYSSEADTLLPNTRTRLTPPSGKIVSRTCVNAPFPALSSGK
jgi:hypothetical protein